jgi:hypothetical protein
MSALYKPCPSCVGPARRHNCPRCLGTRFTYTGLSTEDFARLEADVARVAGELARLKAECRADQDVAGRLLKVRAIRRPPCEVYDDDGEID